MKKLCIVMVAVLALAACSHEQKQAQNNGPTPEDRARALIAQLTLEEKEALMRHDAGGVERLGILPYNWWNEALHGVARNGKATTFPQHCGLPGRERALRIAQRADGREAAGRQGV